MDNILHGLNAAQRDAVTSNSAVLQVLAPPGSGKTKTLTARVAYLIAHHQLKPWNIITCTFTKKAANEMKERIRCFIGEELSRQIKLGTFHAIAVQYLRQYGQYIGLEKDFGIADSSDSKAILKRIIKNRKLQGLEAGKLLGRISARKSTLESGEETNRKDKSNEQQEFHEIFADYEAELKRSNLLDYDDLLLRCCELLRSHPQCVSNVQAVLIDEFQDTNNIQYDLMGLFAQNQNVITIVGDPDQSIYGFRNAEIKNLARMKRQWPDTLTINLKENYRSSGSILHAAQNIIEQDESRPQKKLQATHTPGQRPVLRKLPTAAAEAAWLVAEIKRMRALTGEMLQWTDFAILLRSAFLSRVIETALGKAGVPYRMVGGVKFFERAEVKLIIDYLRVIDQPGNNEAVERIINVPSRKIGDSTLKGLQEEAKTKEVSLWRLVCDIAQDRCRPTTKLSGAADKGISSFTNVILGAQRKFATAENEHVPLVDIVNFIIKKIDLREYLKVKYENELDARWSNVEELVALATDDSDPRRLKAMMEENALPSIDGVEQREASGEDALSLFLANVALTAAAEDKTTEGNEPIQQVTISTIHSAKGLEWPVVLIPACYEGSIPHSRNENKDEERRLLYVGMTRAQAMLYLSCPIKDTKREDVTMSHFLMQPGVSRFFEEHGPSMSLDSATGLATTLKRDPPSLTAFEDGKRGLEYDEDNYWPLNGEEPVEEKAKWDYGKADNPLPAFGTTRSASWVNASSVTMQQPEGFSSASTMIPTGFISVKANYEEILEQNRLKGIDKRADARKQNDIEAPKGRKRQIEGQGTISSFFSKRRQISSDEEQPMNDFSSALKLSSVPGSTLRDIPNFNQVKEDRQPSKTSITTAHKLRNAPLRQKPTSQAATSVSEYMFLSSSPPQPGNDENQPSSLISDDQLGGAAEAPEPMTVQAATYHTTSVQSVAKAASYGKRYGVKPSFNGWANRARK